MAIFSEGVQAIEVTLNGETLGELPPHLSTRDIITTIQHRWGSGDYLLYGLTASGRKGRPRPLMVDEARSSGTGLYVSRQTNNQTPESSALNEVVRLIRRQQDQLAEATERLAEERQENDARQREHGTDSLRRYLELQEEVDRRKREAEAEIASKRLELEIERDRIQAKALDARLEQQQTRFEAMIERLESSYERRIEDLSRKLEQQNAAGLELSERIAETVALRKLDHELPEMTWFDHLFDRHLPQLAEGFGSLAQSGMIDAIVTAIGASVRKSKENADQSATVTQTDEPKPAASRRSIMPGFPAPSLPESASPIMPGFGQSADVEPDEDGRVTF